MKSILIIFLLCALGFTVNAQNNKGSLRNAPANYSNTSNRSYVLTTAGEHLEKHSRQYYIGTGMMVGGYLLMLGSIGAESTDLITVGGLVSFAGLVVQIISHKHIGKAGEVLQKGGIASRIKIQGASDGIGIGQGTVFNSVPKL